MSMMDKLLLWAYGLFGALGWIAVGVLLFGGGCAALGSEFPKGGHADSMTAPFDGRQPGAAGDSGHNLWRASLAALAAGHALDIASSLPSPNTYEANRFMRGHDGDLSIRRAVAYKSAAIGAFAIGQYVLVRRYPRRRGGSRS